MSGRNYTDAEVDALADAHFLNRPVRCPECSGPVAIHEQSVVGSALTDLVLHCRRCDAVGQYSRRSLDLLNLTFTREEKIRIVERYWATGSVQCPRDRALLRVEETKTIGQPAELIVWCRRCGRHFDSSDIAREPDPESYEGRYEELRKISQGGMGAVYLVRQRDTGEELVAKKILPEFLADDVAVRRFQREARILESVRNELIVSVRACLVDEKGGVIIMEYMKGGDFGRAINDQSIPVSTLLNCFDDLANGVEFLHTKGIVHRDLKPGNVLLNEDGRARVADFGLALLLERDSTILTKTGQFVGTEWYAAPEQREGREVGPAADIYALALIAYEVWKRRSPYRSPLQLAGKDRFEQLLSTALNEEPEKRRVTPSEVAAALRLAPNWDCRSLG